MTKVKVDVQIQITGAVGSGKSQISTRILKAIQSDQSLSKICKILPSESFEGLNREQFNLRIEGELLQNAGPKAPKESEVEQAIAEQLVVRIDGLSGALYEYKADHAMSADCRLITLNLATIDAPTDPVGMDRLEDALTSALVSGSQPASTMARGGYVDRCALIKPVISGIAMMERLPGESDAEYRNRNMLPNSILIPPYVPIWQASPKAETGAPEDHAHISKADASLDMLDCGIAMQFHLITYEDAVYPGGLVAGNKVQLIFDDGAIVIGTAGEFTWRKGQATADIVYWRRM